MLRIDLTSELVNPPKKGFEDVATRYAVAVACVAGGWALRLAIAPFVGAGVTYITFFPAVMLAAWFGGLGPGLLATLLSLFVVFYAVIPPLYQLAAITPADAVGGLVFLAVSTFIAVLNEALRRSRAKSEERFSALALETNRRAKAEEDLAAAVRAAESDRDLLRTTLSSIGDAVIAADAAGKVTFLNGTAQKLTGWSQADAAGKPMSDVFVIENEKTRLPVENPVARAMREGTMVGLANHTVLRSREGRSIPIEDSAAPIRDAAQTVLGAVLVFRDVTARRKAAAALKRSEERLQLALNAGHIGVWDWDVAGNHLEWSDLLYQIHGVERGQVGSGVENFLQLVHPDDRQQVTQAIRAALEEDAGYDTEFRAVRPDGALRWISSMATVFRNNQGEATRMLGATTDITARKQADSDLRNQWHTFDTALSNSPDSTYIFDLNARFVYGNRTLLRLLQKPLDEAVGKNFFELGYPPDLAERLQSQIHQVIETQKPVRGQTPLKRSAGDTRIYDYILMPVITANGQVEAVAGSTRDITEQNNVEEALRKSEERLVFALEGGGGGTWDWDIASDLIYCNARFAEIYSVDPERAARGAPSLEFFSRIHPEDRGPVGKKFRKAMDKGGDFAEQYRVVQPDGSVRWLYARGRCRLDPAGKAVRFPGVALDITGNKRVEEDLRRLNKDLQRANRELEEFAYVASHDLQEPLRMVNIYTQIILKNIGSEAPKLNQYAGFVRQGVARMEALIQDLLTFSRAVHEDDLPTATADLSAALVEALELLKDQIDESGCVITAEPLPTVPGDPAQIGHVFQNLLSNAIKYRNTNGSAPQILIAARREEKQWVISVQDNGIGFEPRYAERIFGLFKRLHSSEYPGTGLGLAICRRIVERYGGHISAEGRPGEGATFYFSFPVLEE